MCIISFSEFQCLTAAELSSVINLRSPSLTIEMPDGQLLCVSTLESHANMTMKALGASPNECILNLLNILRQNRIAN